MGFCAPEGPVLVTLPPQALHTQMLTAVQEISHLIEPLATAARAEASQLGHKVLEESREKSEGIDLREHRTLTPTSCFRCPKWLSTLNH